MTPEAVPRVAFFPDSHVEVNGLARTSRELLAAAERNSRPMLFIHAAAQNECEERGSTVRVGLQRGSVSFGLDRDLRFDLLFWRHLDRAADAVRNFRADVIHIASPGDVGQLGVFVSRRLKLPVVGSWHTNLHEFADRRIQKLLHALPNGARNGIGRGTDKVVFDLVLQFYRIPRVLLAPTEELAAMLRRRLKKPVYLMRRGIDTDLFAPARRDVLDGVVRVGYVGRVTAEKRVRILPAIEEALLAAGYSNFKFVVVGDGSERPWLEEHMRNAEFTGVLEGEALARAYANLDVFVCPSETETFGNVVLEALASGVPAVVSDKGGPRTIVRDGVTGVVAGSDEAFVRGAVALTVDEHKRATMGAAARADARHYSWDAVLDQVYTAYRRAVT